MAITQKARDYVLLRLLDAATGKVSDADRAQLRADVHAALGVEAKGEEGSDDYQSREDVHAAAVSADTRDKLHIDPENVAHSDGDPAPADAAK